MSGARFALLRFAQALAPDMKKAGLAPAFFNFIAFF